MADITTRRGVVIKSEGNLLTVKVSSDCHCEGCAIVAFCGSKNDDDLVVLHTPLAPRFSPGDMIEFEPSSGAQWKSILLAFVMPIIIILAAILTLLNLGYSEVTAALAAAIASVVYFGVLGLMFGRRLEFSMNWKITKASK